MDHRKVFSRRLSGLIKCKKLAQKDLADALGVGRPSVSQLVAGVNYPSIDNLIVLADYFSVSIDYLVGRSDDPRVSSMGKEEVLLSKLPGELLPAYQAAKEKNPGNLSQIIETFEKIAVEYHSLSK